jgi:hypothetical protein
VSEQPPAPAPAPDAPRLPYSIVYTCGTDQVPPLDVKVVDVTPDQPSAQAVLERIKAAGLAVADVKTDALVVFGGDDVVRNLVVYAALVGLSGRRPDVAVAGKVLPAGALDRKVRRSKDAGEPPQRPLHVQVGETGRTDMVEIPFAQLPEPRSLSMTRWAKRSRFVPPADALAALHQMVAISGIRARGDEERMPFVVAGNEPPATEDNAGESVGIDLERIRRDAVALRRETRTDDRSVLVEAVELTGRQQRLVDASELPIEDVMARLGASYNEQAEAWHCPRPSRHTNGDASPSMRVAKGKVRCGRCDDERVDSLRLVMDTTGMSPDEAADWLLGPAEAA